MQNVRRKRMVLDNFAVRKINFSSLIKGFLPVEIMRWKLDFMYTSRSCARGQHRAKTRKQMNHRSWHKKDRPAQTSLSLVDLMGFEPTTSRMRTERARKVVSFLPMDCGVWFAKINYTAFVKNISVAFHADLWCGVLLQGGIILYSDSVPKVCRFGAATPQPCRGE